MTWSTRLADQLDVHWRTALAPGPDGLTGCRVHFWELGARMLDGAPGDRVSTCPSPAAAGAVHRDRLAGLHLIVGVLAVRHHHFGGPPADYRSWPRH